MKNVQTHKEKMDWLAEEVNRSTGQLEFLYKLVDEDFEALTRLEVQMKNCFVFTCPGTKEEVEEVLKMTPKSHYFRLHLPEYVLCSALHYPDEKVYPIDYPTNVKNGLVVTGHGQHDCVNLAMLIVKDFNWDMIGELDKQGFLTSHKRFVGRVEAAKLVRKAKQNILGELWTVGEGDEKQEILMSINLY